MDDDYMTVAEFAALPSDAQIAVWQAHAEKRLDAIPALQVLRYRRDQVLALLRELEAPPLFGTPPPDCDARDFGGAPSVLDGRCRCLVCGRCGHHTGNSNQGHYWAWCKVTKSMREFHFCCPDQEHGCELEAAA